MAKDGERSLQPISQDQLARLDALAAADEADLFARTPSTAGRYGGRLIARALCQGGALHYIDGRNGVKDFDVWSFYAALDGYTPYPYRRVVAVDFGPSPHATWPGDYGKYEGRRVDLIGRSISAGLSDDPAEAIRAWLRAGSSSATALAFKAVVLITPPDRRGEVVWPTP